MGERTRLIVVAAVFLLGMVALAQTVSRLPARSSPQHAALKSAMAGSAEAPVEAAPTVQDTAAPTPTPQSLVPTLAPETLAMTPTVAALAEDLPVAAESQQPASPEAEAEPAAQVPVTMTAAASAVAEPASLTAALASRLGVGVPIGSAPFTAGIAARLGLGWYLNWSTQVEPLDVDGLEFVQIILNRGDDYQPNRAQLAAVLAANPGSLWLIGNEPDVPWQDNKTPEHYARIYHELYTFIKTLDPTAQVAIGAISQVTPLRLLYLERILAAYEEFYGRPMPVDVWNIHAFILREERDSWGVSIPRGFEDVDQGMLWEIEDHVDMALFRQQIIDFRRWMARRGERDKPLIVSEYGVLMPEGYGFPPETVAAFMEATFDYLLAASDQEIGYPADDNRLVQRLAWYSFSDTAYPTGNLVEPGSNDLTLVGQAFADYAARLRGGTP